MRFLAGGHRADYLAVVSSMRLSVASAEFSTITLLAWAAGEKNACGGGERSARGERGCHARKKNLRMKTHFGERPSL